MPHNLQFYLFSEILSGTVFSLAFGSFVHLILLTTFRNFSAFAFLINLHMITKRTKVGFKDLVVSTKLIDFTEENAKPQV